MLSRSHDEWAGLIDAAAAPYRRAGQFAWHFARGKLRFDPVFRHILENGLLPANSRVLDIGCGQGLLASLLRSAEDLARAGNWPAGWASAPLNARVHGVELMERDVQRARAALGGDADVVCGDMRSTAFPASDAVVILDSLHYVTIEEQNAVLARVREALCERGRLLLRIGNKAQTRSFRVSQWVDAVVTIVRGHRIVPVFARTLPQWINRLQQLGFEVQARPMSQGTPFANVLLIADVAAQPRKIDA